MPLPDWSKDSRISNGKRAGSSGVEHLTFNQGVRGPNPRRLTTYICLGFEAPTTWSGLFLCLTHQANEMAARYGYVAYHQTDPRGWRLYLLTKEQAAAGVEYLNPPSNLGINAKERW